MSFEKDAQHGQHGRFICDSSVCREARSVRRSNCRARLFSTSCINVCLDEQAPHLTKRSAEPMPELEAGDNNGEWEEMAPEAQKRFTEFVGKRSPYEFLGKRGYEFVGKRGPYEFLGKRGPYEFLGKRGPYEFLGKRGPYEFLGKRGPYEFLGKRPMAQKRFYDFLGKRVQLPYEFVGKRVFGKAWEEETTAANEIMPRAGDADTENTGIAGRAKRYSEWLGKRNQQDILSQELLRQLIDKRISELVRNRGTGTKPEFIGRREEDEMQDLPDKRYNEFIGKK